MNERLRIPLHNEYAAALGLAVYCFATLEWSAITCCERIEPGSVETLADRTAGRVADTLLYLVGRTGQSPDHLELRDAALDFRFVVGTRNNLVHAKPGTAPSGEQALFRHGDQWTLAELEGVADAFPKCSPSLQAALQGGLKR